MVLTLSCFDINVFSISVFKWVFWIKLQWFLINCYTFSEWPYCRSHMIISRAITSSSKTISASVYIFTQEKYQFSFLILSKFRGFFVPREIMKIILVGQVKRERERSKVGSFRISNRLHVFDVILAPWVTRHIFKRPKREFLFFRIKVVRKVEFFFARKFG